MLGAHLLDGAALLATSPTGVTHVLPLKLFVAGEFDLLGVDHDDEITRVKVRGVNRLVFTTDNVSDLNGEAAQDGSIGVDDVPFALVQIYFRQIRFHLRPKFKER